MAVPEVEVIDMTHEERLNALESLLMQLAERLDRIEGFLVLD